MRKRIKLDKRESDGKGNENKRGKMRELRWNNNEREMEKGSGAGGENQAKRNKYERGHQTERKKFDTIEKVHLSYNVLGTWVCAVLGKNAHNITMTMKTRKVKRCVSMLNSRESENV